MLSTLDITYWAESEIVHLFYKIELFQKGQRVNQ